ncbi:chitin deacetylase 1-like [Ylistrum balloti]|uniref:chitin deacetylase 1-like n=1 Tax=Ylistrum balloti TaxID=509963 RepID=UPI002905DF8A|nr:chitin deacetylase 1-like [Ylistrum balloti]
MATFLKKVAILFASLHVISMVTSTEVCNQGVNCHLPDCFCGGSGDPGKFSKPSDIPQMVLFSFDDAVTDDIRDMYDKLFAPNRLNPHGCPISMTMFVSHNFTNYDNVRALYRRGMEVAVHSVTHRVPITYWKLATYDALTFEILQQRKYLSENAGIPLTHIKGWRSPFLQPSGDQQFSILKEENFEYDSTFTLSTKDGNSSRIWPNTLDFGWNSECNIPPCPRGKYPGFWEIPVQMLENPSGTSGCLYTDSCRPATVDETFQLFWANFHSHYTTSRSPLFFTMHPAWLVDEKNFQALDYFLLTLLHYYDDVYFINYQQLLRWIKNPQKLQNISDFSPWDCKWVDDDTWWPATADHNGINGGNVTNPGIFIIILIASYAVLFNTFRKHILDDRTII